MDKKIEIKLGGQKRLDMIQTNFNKPLKVDKKVAEQFESMREQTKQHRSM